ncbi:MAG: hypothetical protein K1X35_02875 [Caulobacteraceae bacterium]|nr:hypothetical protein [Caulobacteraceae bacterium]
MTKRLIGMLAAAVAAGLLAIPTAEAYPDARVEAQTRPDFGLLLQPPVQRRKPHRPHRYRDGDGYRGDGRYGPDHRPDWDHRWGWDGRLRDVAFVDCGNASGPNDINWALRTLAPGGTLIVRAGGAACLDAVHITKPVTIQADGGRPWRGVRLGDDRFGGIRGDWTSLPATLRAPAGQVCLDIAPMAIGEVVLRNLVIESTQGGDQPCIYSEGAHVRLESTVVRYAGDGPAIYVDGGTFEATEDSLVDANTYDRALYAEGAVVTLRDFTVSGTPAIGLDITPSGSQDSSLDNVYVLSKPGSPVFGPSSVGISVGATRTVGRINIRGTRICGFGVGVWTSGPNVVNIDRSHICRSGKGIGAYGGQVSVSNSYIGANVVGIQIGAAYPVILSDVSFYGSAEYQIFREPGARRPIGGGPGHWNYFYSQSRECRVQHRGDSRRGGWGRRERNRAPYYVPDWRNNWGECRDPGSFDRSFFEDEERMGYDQPDAFYSMQPWPQGVGNDENDSNWGSDPLDPSYEAPAPNQPVSDPGPLQAPPPPQN